jgi:transcriptional regulator with XRE-family HTH domain
VTHDQWGRPPIRLTFARACRTTRSALGIPQRRLAELVGIDRSYIARIEQGHANVSLDLVERITRALGLELELIVRPPLLIGDDRRQRDAMHARCSGYVDRRLTALGWRTGREVEIVHGRSHGWIDLLAFDPRSGTLLVIEIKTVLDDIGAVERQIGWYEREARAIARRRGWVAKRIVSWLLVLATDDVDERLRANREVVNLVFPVRAPAMIELLVDPLADWPAGRGLALIDPSSRRRHWLGRSRLDGRRSAAPYRDYRDAATRLIRPSPCR